MVNDQPTGDSMHAASPNGRLSNGTGLPTSPPTVNPEPLFSPFISITFAAQPAGPPVGNPDPRPIGRQDRLTVLLQELKNQHDWLRQNEAQRQAISTVLVTLAVGLIGVHRYFPADTSFIPVGLLGLGAFGVLVVAKYWCRFCFHVSRIHELEQQISLLLPTDGDLLCIRETLNKADSQHYRAWGGWRSRFIRDYQRTPGHERQWWRVGLMQHWLWYLLFFLVSGWGGYLLWRQPPAPKGDAKTELMDADRAFAKATDEKGIDGWMSFMADDAVRVQPLGGKAFVGKAAVREVDAEMFKDPKRKLQWEPADGGAFADGKHGFTTGRYKVVVRTDDGKDEVRSTGAYVSWWRKGGDGKWKVILDTGAPDPPKK